MPDGGATLMDFVVGYHGDRTGAAEVRGRLWVSMQRDYADGYAARGRAGRVVEVDISGLRVLDLRPLGISGEGAEWDDDQGCIVDPALDAGLADALRVAGVRIQRLGHGEMHQRVAAIADAVESAGYDAIAIREWTDGIGEADTVCILHWAQR